MSQPSSLQDERVSKDSVLGLIFDLFPWARPFRRAPVSDYAKAVFDAVPHRSDCAERSHAMSVLQSWIGTVARLRGCSDAQASRLENEIAAIPVMQTGPHLHLAIEPDAFYTHLFSLMGLFAHRRRCYISYACSTVKFLERGRKGPAWLKLEGEAINVFGLSRSKMIPYSILAKNASYRFELRNADRPGHESESVARLRSILPNGEFASAADAIRCANSALWSRYFCPDIDFLQLDDGDVSALVVAHLSDKQSWLRLRLIEDGEFAFGLLNSIDRLSETPWRGWLKNATHFFWGCDGGRLFPLRLDGTCLRSEFNEDLKIEFSAVSLVEALTLGIIVPNLLIMFIVTSILPGVRVLGGSRHAIYYPLMRYALRNALALRGKDPRFLETLSRDNKPGVLGHRVISSTHEPFSLIDGPDNEKVAALLKQFGQMPCEDACGTLSGFTQDPLWAELLTAFASGEANLSGIQ